MKTPRLFAIVSLEAHIKPQPITCSSHKTECGRFFAREIGFAAALHPPCLVRASARLVEGFCAPEA
jgi:hypothetical protein